MAAEYMSRLLDEMGWEDRTRIPLSNDENKALEDLLVSRQRQVQKLRDALTKQEQKQADLDKYKKNVAREIQENSKLLVAHKQHLDEELKLCGLSKSECEALEYEISNIKKQSIEVKERVDRAQCEIAKMLKKADTLKKTVCEDQDTIKDWRTALERSACDIEVIERFTKQDISKAKEMESTRGRLKVEHDKLKCRVTKLCADLAAEDRACERISGQVREALDDRRNMINSWSSAVENLRQRDADIRNMKEDYDALGEELGRKNELYREKQQFLEQQQGNNQEAMSENEDLAQKLANTRRYHVQSIQNNKTVEGEVMALQRVLSNSSQLLHRLRVENKQLIAAHEKKQSDTECVNEKVEELRLKLEELSNKTQSSQQRSKQLDDMLDEEEKFAAKLTKSYTHAMHCLFVEQQKLIQLKHEEKMTTVQLHGCETAISKIINKQEQLEEELLLQKESKYNFEFKISSVQSRIMRVEGLSGDADVDPERTARLEQRLQEHRTRLQLLQQQTLRLNDEMRRLSRDKEHRRAQLHAEEGRLKACVMECEGALRRLEAARAEARAARVEEALARLRVAQAERTLQRLGGAAYSLDKQRIEIDAAMKERLLEIGVRKDMLSVQKRALVEDCGKLRADIREREVRIEQLKNRYEIFCSSLGKDESGQQLSVTFFKIKFAQDRAELQQEGDQLDTEIRRSEQEIAAMEASLKIMDMAHRQFVRHVGVVKDDDPDLLVLEEIREHYFQLKDVLKQVTSDIGVQEANISELTAQVTVLKDKCKALKERESELETDLDELVEQLQRQETKLENARETIRKQGRKAKKLFCNSPAWQIFDLEMCNRAYAEAHEGALRALVRVAREAPDLAERLSALAQELQLKTILQHNRRAACYVDSILLGRALSEGECIATPSTSVISTAAESVGRQSSVEPAHHRRLRTFRHHLAKKLDEPDLVSRETLFSSDAKGSRSSVSMNVVTLGLDVEPVKEVPTKDAYKADSETSSVRSTKEKSTTNKK